MAIDSTIKRKNKDSAYYREKSFYEKLDKSIASTASGPIFTMGENETGEDFIKRMLSREK